LSQVLLVEDDPAVRESVCDVLGDCGIEVACAANGREALDALKVDRARLILLDLHMPVMDGWTFRKAQKQDPAIASIPVVVLTTREGLKRGYIDADDWVAKPLEADELIETVQRYCAGPPRSGELSRWLRAIRPRIAQALGESHPLCTHIDRALAEEDDATMRLVRDLFADDALPNEERLRIGPLPAPPRDP
jgi:two-component system, OmpR family, response regulator CpxR